MVLAAGANSNAAPLMLHRTSWAAWVRVAQASHPLVAGAARVDARAARAPLPAAAPGWPRAAAAATPHPPPPASWAPLRAARARGLATKAGGGNGARGGGRGKRKSAGGKGTAEESATDGVLRAVREGDVDGVRVLCEALKVEDMKAVLRELGGAVYGTRALLLERILCFIPGYSTTGDPREVLGTGGTRRPAFATPRRLIPADAEAVILSSEDKLIDDAGPAPVYTFPSMEGKDVLTGQDLPKNSLLVSKANDAFYNAYETADIKAMRKIWSQSAHVKCCHPGRRFMIGYSDVIKSWQEIFSAVKETGKISVSALAAKPRPRPHKPPD